MNSSDLSKRLQNAALVVVDMQGDYCSPGFYMDKAGYDIERLREPIRPIANVLSAVRSKGLPIIYTRQYRIANVDEAKNAPSFPLTSLKGEPGWEIVPELAPQAGETALDKTTCSAFTSTNLHELLQDKDITTLLFCGNTFDVCVHSTLRSANDLGYKCITLADCCGAVNEELHKWSVESIQVEDGVFGTVTDSRKLIDALG